MDKTRVSAYLARFSGMNGKMKWIVFLAQGAPVSVDPLFDRLSAMPFPRVKGAPIELLGGYAIIVTELGTVHVVDALDGRPIWAFKTRRARRSAGKETGFLESRVSPGGNKFIATLKDSDWIYIFNLVPPGNRSPMAMDPLPRGNLSMLLSTKGNQAFFVSAEDQEFSLMRINIPDGAMYEAPPLQWGEHFNGLPKVLENEIIFSTENAVYVADMKKDLYLRIAFQKKPGDHCFLGMLVPTGKSLISIGKKGISRFR